LNAFVKESSRLPPFKYSTAYWTAARALVCPVPTTLDA